jgi:hypothetical protein
MRTTSYDQTATWKALVKEAEARAAEPPSPVSLVASVAIPKFDGKPISSIVHLVFDRKVVPEGGVLSMAAQQDGELAMSPEHLEAMGYVFEESKIKVVDHTPIGQAYQVLEYWGGDRQHKRWHLAEAITIDPSRKGDPFFMDDQLVAFGAIWKDGDRIEEGLLELLEFFAKGVRGDGCVAHPLVLKVVWQ